VAGYLANQCHANVPRHARRSGGDCVFGWKVWEGDGYVEAEFHCVWRDPSGRLVDITEDDSDETRILFFIDPNRRYKAGAPEGNRVLLLSEAGRQQCLTVNEISGDERPLVVFVNSI
jgi:hypothetical protein